MSTSNVVVINITAAGSGVTQAGFGIPLILGSAVTVDNPLAFIVVDFTDAVLPS